MSNDEMILALGKFQGEVLARLDGLGKQIQGNFSKQAQLEERIAKLEKLAVQVRILALVGGPLITFLINRIGHISMSFMK